MTLRHQRTGAAYLPNPVAAELWRRCDGQHTIQDLADSLAASYELPPALALFDVRTQVGRWFETGLMDISEIKPQS